MIKLFLARVCSLFGFEQTACKIRYVLFYKTFFDCTNANFVLLNKSGTIPTYEQSMAIGRAGVHLAAKTDPLVLLLNCSSELLYRCASLLGHICGGKTIIKKLYDISSEIEIRADELTDALVQFPNKSNSRAFSYNVE